MQSKSIIFIIYVHSHLIHPNRLFCRLTNVYSNIELLIGVSTDLSKGYLNCMKDPKVTTKYTVLTFGGGKYFHLEQGRINGLD